MSYFDDEPYYEPSAADEILSEYQEKMREALLDSIKIEIQSIKTENESLKIKNKKLQNRVNQIDDEKIEAERKKKNLKWEVEHERLTELMKDFQKIMYKVSTKDIQGAKCNKCDENRKIHFISPSGKAMTEDCICAKKTAIYIPAEYKLYEFSSNQDKLNMWFKEYSSQYSDEDYFESITEYVYNIYKKDMNFEKLDKFRTFFKTKEECQKYCDFLNKKKSKEE